MSLDVLERGRSLTIVSRTAFHPMKQESGVAEDALP
jgi:hypothetical protein